MVSANSQVTEILTKAQWDETLSGAANRNQAVLVDFSAEWCGPCRLMGPFFEELSREYPDLVFVKVDVDKVEEVAAEAGISAMPTFQVYLEGAKVAELVGASKDKLKALAEKYNCGAPVEA